MKEGISYSQDTSLFSNVYAYVHVLQLCGLLSHFLNLDFRRAKDLNFDKKFNLLVVFFFFFTLLSLCPLKNICISHVYRVSPIFPPGIITILFFMIKSMIQFEQFCVWCELMTAFYFPHANIQLFQHCLLRSLLFYH